MLNTKKIYHSLVVFKKTQKNLILFKTFLQVITKDSYYFVIKSKKKAFIVKAYLWCTRNLTENFSIIKTHLKTYLDIFSISLHFFTTFKLKLDPETWYLTQRKFLKKFSNPDIQS